MFYSVDVQKINVVVAALVDTSYLDFQCNCHAGIHWEEFVQNSLGFDLWFIFVPLQITRLIVARKKLGLS